MIDLPLNIDYSGKVVVVTGGAGVICSRMVRAFAQSGAKVAILGRTVSKVQALAEELNGEGFICRGYEANVLDKAQLQEVHDRIVQDLGPCDVLINGAGGNHPLGTTAADHYHETREGQRSFFDLEATGEVFDLNFNGTFLPTQVFARDMTERRSGCILNISSVTAYIPLTKIPAYAGAKAAISNFTQWLATHFAGTGIRCNSIAPGFILAEQNRSLLMNEDGSLTPRSQKILAGTPRGTFTDPSELIGAALFLCDDKAAKAITGVVLPVDGGFLSYSGV